MRRIVLRASLFLLCGLAAAQAPAGSAAPQDERLERIRKLMANNLRRLPNYTCTMTVERWITDPVVRRGPPIPPRHSDTLRVEVAEVGGQELIGLPGSKLGDQSLEEIAGHGLIAKGDFANLAFVVFRTNDPKLHFVGEKKLNGKPALEYAYEIALE